MVPSEIISFIRPELGYRPVKRPETDQVCHRGTFFDNAHSPFIILDENLDFVDVNQVALLLTSKEREDVIGKNLTDIFPESKNSGRINAYKEVIRTGRGINVDHLKLEVDGEVYMITLKVFKIEEGLGIAAQDTTKLVNAINELEVTKANLQELNQSLSTRNEELEEFSYVSAHDLKAPLTNVATLLDILREDESMNLAEHPIFQKLEEVSEIMINRINALNNVISLKSNLGKNPQLLVFNEVLEDIRHEISEEISRTEALIISDFSACPTIFIDNLQLHSILQNMVVNAIKYMHPERSPLIHITTRKEGERILLDIKDNGIGFNNKLGEEKVFSLFKRMHTHVEGQGVGLYIVKSIAQSRGGHVEVQSEVNKGTEFKIYL
ncbi:MAG: PAS domain-containing sensor histidine kinase [Pseudozobellia sp.]|nr:PAS domain-containing sensor histidine kinase [Pseudozobellia sp.]|tara:strand:+ start:100320 stop:101462 length:1143 start_codon:yes stop_codon:yes gene_type:complete